MDPKLEDKIKEALLALRWKRAGEGASPGYFVQAASETLRLEPNAASFLARFVTDRVAGSAGAAGGAPATRDADGGDDNSLDAFLDKCSLETIATYLEDHGYTVLSPE